MTLISLLYKRILLRQSLNSFSKSSQCISNSNNWKKLFSASKFSTAASTTNALPLAYTAYNNVDNRPSDVTAAPILILHGLFGSKQNWKSLSKVLASKTNPNRKVYALDARNHGESPHSNEHSYDDLANDIAKFHQDHEISKSIIIGHSMGGRAMMCFALKYVSYNYICTNIYIDNKYFNNFPIFFSQN